MNELIELGGEVDRGKVAQLEAHLRAMPQVEMPVTHYHFHHGYGRELFIPAGTVLTGKIHKFTNLNVLLSGEIAVLLADGTVKRAGPGHVEVAPAGMKRVGYALTDTRWLTVHGTEETDLEKIEAEVIAQDEHAYIAHVQAQLLEGK